MSSLNVHSIYTFAQILDAVMLLPMRNSVHAHPTMRNYHLLGNSRYGPLHLWSMSLMGHQVVVMVQCNYGPGHLCIILTLLHLLTGSRGEYLRVVGIHSDG